MIDPILRAVKGEIARAAKLHEESFNSLHEGYAVLLEEVEEVWEIIREKDGERKHRDLYRELVQVAAMAVKLADFLGGAKEWGISPELDPTVGLDLPDGSIECGPFCELDFFDHHDQGEIE